jgi:hypothetical protein
MCLLHILSNMSESDGNNSGILNSRCHLLPDYEVVPLPNEETVHVIPTCVANRPAQTQPAVPLGAASVPGPVGPIGAEGRNAAVSRLWRSTGQMEDEMPEVGLCSPSHGYTGCRP